MLEWKTCSIEPDLCEIIAGGTPPTEKKEYWNGEILWITPADMSKTERRYISDSERKITQRGIKHSSRKLMPTNSVIISCRAPVGYCVMATEPFTTNQGCKTLLCKNIEPGYLYYYLLNSTANLVRVSSGTTFLELSKKELGRFQISFPSDVPTQRKIVEVLESIDDVIDRTREFIAKYSNIKLGMLHDLFETHLKSCVTHPLGEIANIQRGGSPRPIQDYITDSEDGINWIKIGDTSLTSKYILSAKEKIIPAGVRHSRKVKPGDFVLSNSMSFGRPYIVGIDGCVHDGWLVISDYEDSLDVNYLYYILCTHQVQKQLEALAAGSTVQNLKSDTVKKVVIPVPSDIGEQKRLAEMISAVDEKLDNERTYFTKLENTKRGLIRDLLEDGYDISPLL